ncbi:MAG: hypothetical protein ACOX0F_05285 [Syntrophomonadaceae bacterium]
MNYLFLALLIIISLIEIPCLTCRKQWGELIAVICLLIVSMIYGIAYIQNWQLPTLKQGVEVVFKPVTVYLEGLFS